MGYKKIFYQIRGTVGHALNSAIETIYEGGFSNKL
jgi:hypothetical protein